MAASPHKRPKARRIPISAGKRIADLYGYDQVVIVARRVEDDDQAGQEWMTTYGRNRAHCDIAARIGRWLRKRMNEYEKARIT